MLEKKKKNKKAEKKLTEGEIWLIELNKIIMKTEEQNRALEKLIGEKKRNQYKNL